eukprot:TRINITY_DN36588_c0_g1_i1.p1 TRINITY_DN36588_c0_g1~~TRINITY_DN36588_c0_g1_i1.p1  ORF type:complete len:633 (+),score=153.92 TRINITY_DN36588_c0_g1_i1:62-1900(+)
MKRCLSAIGLAVTGLPGGASARTFRFIALGDFGTGGYAAGQVAEVSCAQHFHEISQEYDAQFTISVGDNMYVDPNSGMRDSFENTWCPKGTHGGGLWFPTRGNHDNHGPQMQYTRDHESKWYWPSVYFTKEMDTGLGFTVQVWSVDTGDGSGAQQEWLKRTLGASKARWKIINTHYPFTNAGRHARVPVPVTIAAIAREYGAQIYFNGHDHIIQTSVNQGVVFVTTGAVARGAMMDRNIQRDDSKFVFTLGVTSSVGAHGFMVLHLTKNVAWGSIFGFGGMVDEFATVWDWPAKYSEAGKTELPTRDILRRYMKQEAEEGRKGEGEPPAQAASPPAVAASPPPVPAPPPSSPATSPPSGAAAADGSCALSELVPPQGAKPDCGGVEVTDAAVAAGKRVGSGGRCVLRTSAGRCGDAVCSGGKWESPSACSEQLGEGHSPNVKAAGTSATFLVTGSCRECPGPTMGSLLTVWIQGVKFGEDTRHRVFLAFDDDVCRAGDVSGAVAGAHVQAPRNSLIDFTPQGVLLAPTPAYVCFSADHGKTYSLLREAHSNLPAFTLWPKSAARQTNVGAAPAPSGGGQSGSDLATVIGIALFGVGAGLAWTWRARGEGETR